MNDRAVTTWTHAALVLGLVGGAAAGSRLLELPPNFAAVGAAALYAGYVLGRPLLALALPLVAMLVSDAIIGFYDVPMMVIVYASLALPALWSCRWGRVQGLNGTVKVASATVGAGLLFFATTNLGWWWFWTKAHTLSGLVEAYVAAIPFLKYTLASNVLFAGVFFGCDALVRRALARRGLGGRGPARGVVEGSAVAV